MRELWKSWKSKNSIWEPRKSWFLLNQCENHENHANYRNPFDNHENYENHLNLCENHEIIENPRHPCEYQDNQEIFWSS